MTIALKLLEYLEWREVDYDIVRHPHSDSSINTAHLAHVPEGHLAKGVMLEDDDGYLLAVLPANSHVNLSELHRKLNRHLGLATEKELEALFDDCEVGAVPPLGEAYDYDVVVDDSLWELPEVYFESGDHRELVHVKGKDFQRLLSGAQRVHFSA